MATNEILEFAGDPSALAETYAQYLANVQRVIGNQPGAADPAFVNKVLQQTAKMSAMLGKFIVDESGNSVLDSQTVAEIEANLLLAIKSLTNSSVIVLNQTMDFQNLGFVASIGSSQLTVRLKGLDGNDPSTSNTVTVPFRNGDITVGIPNLRKIQAAMNLVIPATASLGFSNTESGRLYFGLVDNYTVVPATQELCVCSSMVTPEDSLATTVAIGSGSVLKDVIYSNDVRSNVPIRWIAYVDIQYGYAAWTHLPTRVQIITSGASDSIMNGIGEGHISIMPWAYSGITQGSWAWLTDAYQAFNGEMSNTNLSADNDQIDYECYLAVGTYTVTVLFKRTLAIAANLHVLLDGIDIGNWSCGGGDTYNLTNSITGIVITKTGLHSISIKAIGSGSPVYFSCISLFRTK